MQVRVVGEHRLEGLQSTDAPAVAEKTPGQFIRWTFKVFFWPEVISIACFFLPMALHNSGNAGLVSPLIWVPLYLLSMVVAPVLLLIHFLLVILVPPIDYLARKYGNDRDD